MTRRSTAVPRAGARIARPRELLAAAAVVRDWLGGIAYPVVFIVAVGVVFAGQWVEDLTDASANNLLTPPLAVRRWALIALVIYELAIARVVERTVRRSLTAVRRAVRVDDAEFAAYERSMTARDFRVDIVSLVASAFVTVLLFLALGVEPLADDPSSAATTHLPVDPVGAAIVLAGYVVLGWAGTRLLIATTRLGLQLGRLSREQLEINVFDTANLLPFGNIALAVALAPAGIIAILLLGLGAPTSLLGWTALVLATLASVLALLLPLRGIHHEMYVAKDAALATLNARITNVYNEVTAAQAMEPSQAGRMSDATSTLIQLRRAVHEMTTWPFRDTVALARALLIASAPLIYTTLSELIKILLGR